MLHKIVNALYIYKKRLETEHIICLLFQLIQTISAIDTDDPLVGHKFVFSLSLLNPNFTIFDNEGE